MAKYRRWGGTEERCQDFPPAARTSEKAPVNSGLGSKIADNILGKAVFLLLGFCLVGHVPVSDIKL